MFLHVLAMATLFNLAFFLPTYFGYCILLVPIVLFLTLRKGISVRVGLLLSALIYLPHFVWLPWLLNYKSGVSVLGAIAIYAIAVLGFAVPTTFWLVGTSSLLRLLGWMRERGRIGAFVLSCALFSIYIEQHSLWFVGALEGYPFLNFRIPTAQVHTQKSPFVYLQPDAPEEVVHDPGVMGQRIYQKLARLNVQNGVIVAPESTFPFPLNEYPEIVKLWAHVLGDNAHLLIGAQRKEGKNFYQTLYWLHQGRIKNYYDKKHAVVFCEKMPRLFAHASWARSMLLHEKSEITEGEQGAMLFELSDNVRVLPIMCSELFVRAHKPVANASLAAWFVNDSWFPGYMKELMLRAASLRARTLDVPLLYITHTDATLLHL